MTARLLFGSIAGLLANLLVGSLVGAVPCRAQDPDLRARINDALDVARPALLDHLAEGARRSTRPGELALLVLAALHDGVPTDDKPMAKAMQRLARARPNQTYDLALRLMVLEACPTFPDRDRLAAADAKDLLQHRSDEGTFQYMRRPAAWDLSNTQYGALGLRAAAALGIEVRRDVWLRLAREIGDQQRDGGGFGYTRLHSGQDDYASMTAAGIAVLAVCRQGIGENHPRAAGLTVRIAQGWQWFASRPDTIGSVTERWSYYFHYGLERAAILCDVERVGDVDADGGGVDWYAAGARMLVDEQLPGGGWRSLHDGFPGHHLSRGRGDAVPTSFAILFLRRKFQKVSGPITPHIVTLAAVGPKARDGDVDACAQWLIGRGKDAMHDIVKGLRSDIEPQRRAARKALVGIAGEDFGFRTDLAHDDNRDAVRRAELWYLRNR